MSVFAGDMVAVIAVGSVVAANFVVFSHRFLVAVACISVGVIVSVVVSVAWCNIRRLCLSMLLLLLLRSQ